MGLWTCGASPLQANQQFQVDTTTDLITSLLAHADTDLCLTAAATAADSAMVVAKFR